ncbi:unnamed protein product [Schistocephalus solidus]|uniref:Ig-like domain-containing protein n=1 Tax=Schistocephalus solidus TaxID=70667 RepID=A0A183T3E2_SCHSO|nr:unnamed protein product [Schistocephalus solidus]
MRKFERWIDPTLFLLPCIGDKYKPSAVRAKNERMSDITKNYKYKAGARGLEAESASRAAASVSRPIKRKYKTRDGERLILTCPVRGSVHSPISWFFLDVEPEEAQNFTNTAFSEETFGKVGSPAAWIALWRQQLNLSDLFVNSSGRITLDPAYNIIYHEVRTTKDMNFSKYGALPLQHLACIHGDARGENFRRADWAGEIFIESIPRWKYYFIITGLGTVLSTLMPAALSICTILIAIWGLSVEIRPKMEAAASGHAYRDTS